MALAFSYRRVSSGGQAKDGKSGLLRQEQALAEWLRGHPQFSLAEELIDPGLSAYSGTHRLRGALGRFLRAAEGGTVPVGSVLVVEDFRRFSREEPVDALKSLIFSIWDQGLGFACCAYESGKPLFKVDAGGIHLAILSMMFSQAHSESQTKSAWSRGGWKKIYEAQDRGERPRHGIPYWIDRDEACPQDPFRLNSHSRAVEAMFRMCLAGMGQTQIADELNRDGFHPAPSSKNGRWNRGQVSQRLRDLAVTGMLERKNSHDIPAYYPSVISRETFDKAQRAKASRDRKKSTTKARKAHFLFSGLVRCAGCGSLLTYRAAGRYARPGHPGYITCMDSCGAVAIRGESRCREQLGAWRKQPTMNLPLDEAEALLMATLSLADWQNLFPVQSGPEVEVLRRQIRAAEDERVELQGKIQRGEQRLADELMKESPNEIQIDVLTKTLELARRQLPEAERLASEFNYRLSDLQPADPLLSAQATAKRIAGFLSADLEDVAKRMQFNSWLQQLGVHWVVGGDLITLRYNRPGPEGDLCQYWGTVFGELHALRAMGHKRGLAFLFAGKHWFQQLKAGKAEVSLEHGPVWPSDVASGLQEIACFRAQEMGIDLDGPSALLVPDLS